VLVAVVAMLFASQSVPLTVAAPSNVPSQAVALALTIIPPTLPADGGSYPAVVVSLLDSNNLPSAALSNLTIFLTSSQTNIASVPNTVTLPEGSEYVVVNVVTTPTPGSTTITASSHGLSSVEAQLSTKTPSGFPSKLEVFVSPSSLLPRSDTGTVRVELVDDAGFPSKAITSVTALLVSSNTSIASLNQNSLTINPGDIYASGTFHSPGHSGQAIITASSSNYVSGGAIVTVAPACTRNCAPSELLLKLVPGTLPTSGLTYSTLEVGLATTSGQPAVSSSSTIVQLSSSEPDLISVPPFVTIPAGNISVLADLTTSSLEGRAIITASSSSLTPMNATVITVIPAPSKLQAYVAPPATFATAVGNAPILVVQLQDSLGNPARARVLTNVTVTSSNSSLVSGPLHLSIGVGLDFVFIHLSVTGSGQSELTASAQGLTSTQESLQVVRSPLVDTLTASVAHKSPYGPGTMWANDTATLTLTVTFLGKPVQNLSVAWTVKGGTITPTHSQTGFSDVASTTFTPTVIGTANVTASTTSPETGPITRSFFLTVIQVPVKPPRTLVQVIESLWYYIAAAAAVAVIAAFYLLRMRRKKQRAEIEAGFEVV